MRQIKHFKWFLLGSLLLLLVLASGVTLAKWVSELSGSSSARIAYFAITAEGITSNELSIVQRDGEDHAEYRLTVTNKENDVVSEVSMNYKIVVKLPESLPETVQLTMDSGYRLISDDGLTYTFLCSDWRFGAGIEGIHTRNLSVDADVENMPVDIYMESIQVYAESKQIQGDLDAPVVALTTPVGTTNRSDINNVITVSGTVEDEGEIAMMVVNGQQAVVSQDGTWSVDVAMEAANTSFWYLAVDQTGNVNGATVTITDYTVVNTELDKIGYVDGEENNLQIPAFFQDTDGAWYRVTGIHSTAPWDTTFGYDTSITSVTIPNTFTEIPNYCFIQCNNLESISLPDCISRIGVSAFSATALTEFEFPSATTEIGAWALSSSALTEITIPGTISDVPQAVFQGCAELKTVKIQEGVQGLGPSVFFGCTSLTEINIPSGVISIADGCFSITSDEALATRVTLSGNPVLQYDWINSNRDVTWVIPEGGAYYVGWPSSSPSYCPPDVVIYGPGEEFPETVNTGDVFVCGSYEYRYNLDMVNQYRGYHNWIFTENEGLNGWSVRVKDTSILEFEAPLVGINNYPLVKMSYLFNYVKATTLADNFIIPETVTDISHLMDYSEITDLPDNFTIPASVDNMTSAFAYRPLNGVTITINANPSSYASCFAQDNAGAYMVYITGSSSMLSEIAATGSPNVTIVASE